MISSLKLFWETWNIDYTSRWKEMSDYNLYCTGNLDSAVLSKKTRHQWKQTGAFFLAWKKSVVISQLGRFCSLSEYLAKKKQTKKPHQNVLERTPFIFLYTKREFNSKLSELYTRTQMQERKWRLHCSLHQWMLAAYSIEILGNYSVTCWDSIWSHLPWKTGQNLLFITQHNCRAGCITEVGEITAIPILKGKYSCTSCTDHMSNKTFLHFWLFMIILWH